MKLRVIIGVMFLTLTTGCAVKPASEPAGKPGPQTTAGAASQGTGNMASAAQKDGSKIRCEEEPVTNSRLRKNKVCMTEAAWADRSERARSAWDEVRRPATAPGPDPRQEAIGH